jgi:hypothetical protein
MHNKGVARTRVQHVVAKIGVHVTKAQQEQVHNKGATRIGVCTTNAQQEQMHVQ